MTEEKKKTVKLIKKRQKTRLHNPKYIYIFFKPMKLKYNNVKM